MRSLCAEILFLLLTGALYAQQPQEAKLTGFRDAAKPVSCSFGRQANEDELSPTPAGGSADCSDGSVRIYTLEIGPMVYDVEAYDIKAPLLSAGLIATRGPLYGQPIGTDWQVTMDGKNYLRVLGPKKGKGYRFLIVAAHTKP